MIVSSTQNIYLNSGNNKKQYPSIFLFNYGEIPHYLCINLDFMSEVHVLIYIGITH